MNGSRRRIHEELRMVEKQLPLYYRRIRELERRQQELYAHLGEQDMRPPMTTRAEEDHLGALETDKVTTLKQSIDKIWSEKYIPNTGANTHVQTPDLQIKPLGATAKNNVLKILETARQKFGLLGDGVNQALSYIDTMQLVLNLVEYSGGELQQNLLKTASLIQQQVDNPPPSIDTQEFANDQSKPNPYLDRASDPKPLPVSPETIAEFMQSPLFQELAAQLQKKEKGQENGE